MKILHLLASPAYTGPAETITQLALAQRALGHEVTVAVDRLRTKPTSEEPIVPRLETHGLLDTRGLELSVKSMPWRMAMDALAMRRSGVDVVHSHFSHDHTIARLGTPKGARLIRSIHAPRSLRWTLPRADGFTVPMDELARQLLGQRVLILPAFVDAAFVPVSDKRAVRERLGLPTAGKLIGMVSTFQPTRHHSVGLDAFKALASRDASVRLVLVGDGELEAALRAQAAPLGEAVHFAGYQSGPRFVEHLQSLDEVWILGLGNDWSARAAAQARACGVRVIAVDEGALSRYADVMTELEQGAIARASELDGRKAMTLESAESIARRVLQFYEWGPR